MIMVMIASVLGNIAGYWFGYKKAHCFMKERKHGFLKGNILFVQGNYDKYGKPTIFLGKFLPFIRTFAP
jgi:membrane-associated protein